MKLNVMTNHRMLAVGWQRVVTQWLGNGSEEEMGHFQFARSHIPGIEGRSCDHCTPPRAAHKDSTTGKKPHVTVGKNDIS